MSDSNASSPNTPAGSAVSDPNTGMTKEAVPSAPPTSVSISSTSTSSITVQWGAVDCIHQNWDITGYLVQYGVLGLDCTVTLSVSGGPSTEATISGLTNNVIYSIAVAAINSAGIGVYSNPIMVKTDEGDACPQTKGFEHTEVLVGGVVGGFVGGVLLTATLGAVTFAVFQRMRTKAETSSGGGEKRKSCISTSTNLAYGQVEGIKTAEYEICGIPSGAAMATQEPAYEIVPT